MDRTRLPGSVHQPEFNTDSYYRLNITELKLHETEKLKTSISEVGNHYKPA